MGENDENISFFSLKILHENCWTSYVPENYKDILVGYTYSSSVLQAIRFSKYYNHENVREIKSLIKKDESVKRIRIYNINSPLSIVDMDVAYDNAFIHKLIKKAIYPLKSSVNNNIEKYIFIMDKSKTKEMMKIPDDTIHIKSIKELNAAEVFTEISSYMLDILLTDKEKLILKTAKNNNFFSIPRGMSNKLLAERLNVSKMSVNVEIRKAINKIINNLEVDGQ